MIIKPEQSYIYDELQNYSFGTITPVGANGNILLYTSGAIRGEIVKISVGTAAGITTGSLFIVMSGVPIGSIFVKKGAFSAVTEPQYLYTNVVDAPNVVGQSGTFETFYVDRPLSVTISGFNTLGTPVVLNHLTLHYR